MVRHVPTARCIDRRAADDLTLFLIALMTSGLPAVIMRLFTRTQHLLLMLAVIRLTLDDFGWRTTPSSSSSLDALRLLCWNRVAAVARNAVTALHPIRSIPPLAFWYI